MTRPLHLLLVVLPFASSAQEYYVNDFDGNLSWPELPIVLDTAASHKWQIGEPQKNFFTAAFSPTRAIMTDTALRYPQDNFSRFTAKLPVTFFQWWPEFFLQFQQSWDMDSAHAGGYIEISYDTGATWMNVFEDWVNPPNVQIYQPSVGYVQPDTLSNGELGFTGRSQNASNAMEWVWTSLCWVQSGIPLPDTLLLRFNFYSDTVANMADGWIIDDLNFQVYIAHPISEYMKMDRFLVVAPNPITDRLYVNYDTDGPATPVHIDVIDGQGRLLHTVVDRTEPEGLHNMILWRRDLPTSEQLLFLRASIGGREHLRRLLLAP